MTNEYAVAFYAEEQKSIEIEDNLEAALEQFIGIYEELGGAEDTPSEVNPFTPRS